MCLTEPSSRANSTTVKGSANKAAVQRQTSVLFVVDSTFPGLGGAEIQALNLASALRERGVQVHFVSPRVHAHQRLRDSVDDFEVVRIDYPHIRIFGTAVLLCRFAGFLWRHRRDYQFLHVHVTRLLAAVASTMRPITGVPVVTKISGYFEFEGGVLDMQRRFAPLNRLLRYALRQVDYVQTISQETREKLLAAGFDDHRILLIPNGIDTRRQASPPAQNDEIVVGYCGRLRQIKGVHVLLDSFALACEKLPTENLKLRIAGDGEESESLQAQMRRLDLESRITFVGRVDDTDAFLSQLHVYVQPSFAEGLPNSVIEAMLAARPVIVSNIGGNRDLVKPGRSGYLFPAGDSEALAQKIVKLAAASPATRRQFGQAGRKVVVERYGFDRVATQLMELYRGQQN